MSFKTVKAAYRLSQSDVAKIQLIELDILRVFIFICSSLSLRYYLHGGTLLGAELYKGFIPWDDDIDVSMPRKDYEVFLKEAHQYLPSHLFLQTCYTDKEYTLCFAKIRDKRTELVEWALQNRNRMVNGVYIDIFPIDEAKSRRRPLLVRALRRRIDMSYWDVERVSALKKMLISLLVFPLLFISANKATRMLDKYRKKHLVAMNGHQAPLVLINRWFYPSDYYFPYAINKAVFCGLEVNTVRNPKQWLYIDYPHWPTIPPKEEQKPGHLLVRHTFYE